MDCLDFLFEALSNSLEAGALDIALTFAWNDGLICVTVEDDGECGDLERAFEKGFSTKAGHGMGLSLLKDECPDARLERNDGRTKLSYSFPPERGGRLSEVLPFLVQKASSAGARLEVELFGRKLTLSDGLGEGDAPALARAKRECMVFDWK